MNGKKWRMESPCKNCPFSDSPDGVALRDSLKPGRLAEIKSALKNNEHFVCHKTGETGGGKPLMCAGAIAWQNARGYSSNLQRICERIDASTERRKQLHSGKP